MMYLSRVDASSSKKEEKQMARPGARLGQKVARWVKRE